MSFVINPFVFAGPALDPDAQAYIDAVELEDGQALEDGVRTAINDFVVGCKSDGIWSAIKAACILAGARTLDGALVPLVGSAPTNNNFVSGDYDRETGLVGNGSTKYLDSNRAADSDPQNSAHISSNITTNASNVRSQIGYYKTTSPVALSGLLTLVGSYFPRINNSTTSMVTQSDGFTTGLFGATRSNSSNYQFKPGTGSVKTLSISSSAPPNLNHYVFALNVDGAATYLHPGRLSFYSIGESLDLADLDSRVSTLMTDIAAAIP